MSAVATCIVACSEVMVRAGGAGWGCITKTTALGVLDAVRHRKGLIDHVDLSGLTCAD